jgi:predicted Rossmann fold nucleotide-binding protein DprA/Smf involved in DNA uptake
MEYLDTVKEYYRRNKLIAEESDILIALVAKDRKGGTEHTIKEMLKLNKQVVIL